MIDRHLKNVAARAALLLLLAPAATFADRGRGSIREAARPAPAPQPREQDRAAPPRGEPVREEPARQEPERGRPDEHVDVHAPPPPAAHRDWDDNDESAARFGGFAHGAPERVIRGTRVHDLPPAHYDVVFQNRHFYWDQTGAYYEQQSDGQYLVVQPPVGVAITALPSDTEAIVVGPTTFYYLDGVFYVAQGNTFAVVTPPAGIVVSAPPSGATQVVVNGAVAYQFNGFNYVPSIQDGVTAYTVSPM